MLQLLDTTGYPGNPPPLENSNIKQYFELVVSVADELQQNAAGNLTDSYDGVFVRGL